MSISMTAVPFSVHTKLKEIMTPFLSSSAGRSQVQSRLVPSATTSKYCGGPLGAAESKAYSINPFYLVSRLPASVVVNCMISVCAVSSEFWDWTRK